MLKRFIIPSFAVASFALAVVGTALGQSYPAKPVKVITPFAPGGATDIVARAICNALTSRMGVNFFVENRPGGSGAIAAGLAARAEPDGYTLLFGSDSLIVQALINKDFPVNPLRDLTPIATLGVNNSLIAVAKSVPVNDIKGLISYAKENPGKLTYGSGGNFTTQHFAGELLSMVADISIRHIPYKGTAPAINDALAGQIDIIFAGWGELAPHLASGALKALASVGAHRVPAVPNLPTMIELGYPNYVVGTWMGIVAPANLSASVQTVLSDNIAIAAQSSDFALRVTTIGLGVSPLKGKETGEFMRARAKQFGELIARMHIAASKQ